MVKLTQGLINDVMSKHPSGTQLHDDDMPGLRVVIGSKSASFKLVGRINDKTNRYISVIIGRTNEVTLRTARERAAELRLALRRGEDPRRPVVDVPTLKQALERYLTARGDDIRPRTHDIYRKAFEGPLKSLHKLKMDAIDRETVRSLHESLTEKRGPYMANGALRVLKAIYNDAARSHDLPPNPVSRAVRFNKSHSRDWAVGADGLPALWQKLDAMENRTQAVVWLIMLLTGLRVTDACSMKWEHIDADGVLFVPSPKGGPDRSFKTPLPRMVRQELARIKEETAKLESPYVFASRGKKYPYLQNIYRCDAFPYAPHAMRHTYRTAALEAGVDLQLVLILMNHRPQGVTWTYVTRDQLIGPMREAQEKIASAISRHRGMSEAPSF